MSDPIYVKGGTELQKFLSQFPAKFEANVIRAALRAGAVVVKNEAKKNLPVRHGALKKSLRVSTRIDRRTGKVTASVKTGSKEAFYWRFVEFGTKAHIIKPKSKKMLALLGRFFAIIHHPGAKKHPVLRPALDAKAQEAVAAVARKIRERLTKEGINLPDEGDS